MQAARNFRVPRFEQLLSGRLYQSTLDLMLGRCRDCICKDVTKDRLCKHRGMGKESEKYGDADTVKSNREAHAVGQCVAEKIERIGLQGLRSGDAHSAGGGCSNQYETPSPIRPIA